MQAHSRDFTFQQGCGPMLNMGSYYVISPVLMICDTMDFTRFDGMAKPTPLAGVLNSGSMAVGVGMPMRLP